MLSLKYVLLYFSNEEVEGFNVIPATLESGTTMEKERFWNYCSVAFEGCLNVEYCFLAPSQRPLERIEKVKGC